TKKVPYTACETYCVPGKTTWVKQPKYVSCFDPCTCQTVQKQQGCTLCRQQCPSEMKTRQVTRYHTVCEQVPCTQTVRRTVCQQVPVTVCKKVPYTYSKQVPVTVTRMVRETHVERVPYTTVRTVRETVRTQVPVNVSRNVRGAYVDQAALPPGQQVPPCG